MSDTSTPTCGTGSNREARAAMRQQLRQSLLEGRATLRHERDVAAAAAIHRAPRWRPARPDTAARPVIPVTTAPDADPTETSIVSSDPARSVVEGTPDSPQEAAPGETASVFAAMMDDIAERHTRKEELPPPAPTDTQENPGAACPSPDIGLAPVCAGPAVTVTALGPGMLARLRLLGYAQITDLANADPDQLRAGLGDISRLLNVEGWIAEARRALPR